MSEDEIDEIIDELLAVAQCGEPNPIPRELCQRAAELIRSMRDRLEELEELGDDGEDW